MPRRRGPVTGRRFPHLLAEDSDLWAVWLEHHGDEYERFEYDVRVGFGYDPGRGVPMEYRSMARDLSTRRIDAIGFQAHWIELFEVTRLVGFKAVGQYIGYPILYNLTGRTNLRLRMSLVTAAIGGDMEQILRTIGARTYLVDVAAGTVREAWQ